MTNNNLTELNKLKNELEEELLNKWNETSEDKKESIHELLSNFEIFHKNARLEMEKDELKIKHEKELGEAEKNVKELTQIKNNSENLEKAITELLLGYSKTADLEDSHWHKDDVAELINKVKDDKLNEVIIKIIEKLKEDSECHYDFIKACEELCSNQRQSLREEISDKNKKIEVVGNRVDELESLVSKLTQQLDEKSKKLDIADRKIEEQETKINELDNFIYYSVKKALPDLPKKQNKFRQLKSKIKTGYQKLIEKKKEFIARIEVRTK